MKNKSLPRSQNETDKLSFIQPQSPVTLTDLNMRKVILMSLQSIVHLDHIAFVFFLEVLEEISAQLFDESNHVHIQEDGDQPRMVPHGTEFVPALP
jgi:hypothetical protein